MIKNKYQRQSRIRILPLSRITCSTECFFCLNPIIIFQLQVTKHRQRIWVLIIQLQSLMNLVERKKREKRVKKEMILYIIIYTPRTTQMDMYLCTSTHIYAIKKEINICTFIRNYNQLNTQLNVISSFCNRSKSQICIYVVWILQKSISRLIRI